MKKFFIYLIVILFIFAIGFIIFYMTQNNNKNNNNSASYNAARTETNISEANTNTNIDNMINSENTSNNIINKTPDNNPKFIEVSSFTTKIYDKDSSRQNNIEITCNLINNAEVLPEETFSFSSLVRQSNY